ncbi:MAG TPA: PAS domain S-box protein [Thermodesulfobacteriota bacterium]|nr:PAS domain S-box protein [Thermodesulfobacteriota bacterium]
MLFPRPIKRITFFSIVFLFILSISELSVTLAPAQGQPKVLPVLAPKGVLLLYTYGDGLPAYEKATPAFISVMTAAGINTNDLFFEYLDLQRNNSPEYRTRLADLLRYKYAKHEIGLIVTVHTEALNFLLNEGNELFPDAPVFSYLIVRPELIEASKTGRRILQRPQNLDMKGTLEIALKMFPRTRKIVFVTGAASGDRRLEYEAKVAFEPWRDKLEFQYTSDRSVDEILQLVANLPPQSIVIYCNVFSDKTGRTFIPREVGKMVAQAANAPVFCLWDTLIGNGPIGGSLMSFEAEGAYAAKVALDILNGKMLLTKPVTTLMPSKTFMFDWQQLKRWGVNESILPKESVLVNRVPTLWEQYKGLVIGGIVVILVLLSLVIGLLVQRHRKSIAEEALKEQLRFERLVSDLSAKFQNVAPSEIDREIEGALKKIIDFFRVSHCVLIKGFSEERRAVITHAAHAENIPPTPLGGNLYSFFPWAAKMLAQGEIIWIPTLDRLPAEAATDKETCRNLGVRSYLIVPIFIENLPGYAISISVHEEGRAWSRDYIPRLQLLGEILINTLERKRAENALWQKTEELDQFFNVSVDVLCIANTDGYFLRLNPAAERILGYTREELTTSRFFDFIHPDDLDKTRKAVSALASQEKVFLFKNRYRCKDGRYRWLEWSSVPVGNTIYAAARDITEHKEAEEDLKRSEERFRMLVETMNEGLGVQNENGVWTYANDQLCWMLGRLPGDIAGHPVTEFLDQANRTVLEEEIQNQRKGKYSPYEITWTHKDGKKVTTIVSPKPIFNPRGRLKEVFAVITDITERKRVEEMLRERGEAAKEMAREAFVLAEIGRTVSSTLNIDQIYEAFATEAKKIITFDRIVISLIDIEKKAFRNVYIAGEEIQDRGTEDVYPIEGSGHAEMLRTRSTVLVQTEDSNEYKDRFPMLLSTFEAGFRSIMNVPLFSKGEIIGGLLLRSRKPNAYTDKDVRVAESIGNQIAGAVAIAQLFQEQKQMENKLRESEERFLQVADNVGDFIWEVDANGLYRYTSPSVEKILGYRPDELVGKKHFYDLFVTEVREKLKAAALNVFAAKQSFRAFPNQNVNKEGKVVHLETSGGPMLDETGNLVGYRGADTDVSERKRTEQELRKYHERLEEMVKERTAELIMARDEAEVANRAKSSFLANMSHELRTPLNSILGIAQLMERDAGFPDHQRDTLKILSRSGTHLLELINDVLELSKIEAGKMTSDITSFDFHSFLGDLEEMIRLRAEGKGLTLRFEYKSPLPHHIETDVRKLRQILINLLGNAIKYTEKGGVTLRTRFKEGMGTTLWGMPSSLGHLEFEIEDTGIGIAPEDMQRIFEPFVQVNPGRTVRDGTGLGLTLSRMFVELLGGEITLRSQVGRGSTFAFDIAVKPAEAATVHTEEADRQVIGLVPGQPPYRLLVVDDSVENRFVLRRLLERVGFSVLEATGGQEAVDLSRSAQPHLIWMDLRMPGMDGNEAARRIREAENGGWNEEGKETHIPIIALTAGVMKGESPPSHSRVFDGLVYKPFREKEIFDEIEKHLGVQFVCRSSMKSAMKVENARDTAVLTPADLSVLPITWLREFFQTLRKGRSTQLLNLIDQISPDHADLAGALAGLVRIHRFDKLIALTEGTLKENSNG